MKYYLFTLILITLFTLLIPANEKGDDDTRQQSDFEHLLKELNNDNVINREKATTALIEQGSKIIPKINECLAQQSPEVKLRLLTVIEQLYYNYGEATHAAKNMLDILITKHNGFSSKKALSIVENRRPWDISGTLEPEESRVLTNMHVEAYELLKTYKNKSDKKILITSVNLYRKSSRVPIKTHRSNCLYNMACCYSLLNEKKMAIECLDISVNTFGFSMINHLKNDADLKNICNEPGYLNIFKKIKFLKSYREAEYLFSKKEYNRSAEKFIECATYEDLLSDTLSLLLAKKSRHNAACCHILLGNKETAKRLLEQSNEDFESLLKNAEDDK